MENKELNIYACKCDYELGGGVILVAAYSKLEAFRLASRHPQTRWLFEVDERGELISNFYPFNKWHWLSHLSTELKEPTLIIENHYRE